MYEVRGRARTPPRRGISFDLFFCIVKSDLLRTRIADQLQADLEALMNEFNDLSRQNDELIASKDSDLILIRDLGNELKEYKRKYEQAKTELRSVVGKNSARMFLLKLNYFFFIH